jgi:hypothetical protein
MWRSVDLPAPDGPMIETNSPDRMSRLIARKIHVVDAPLPTDFSMPFVVISESAKSHSFIAQRHLGRDAHRPPCRNVRREKCDRGQQHSNRGERPWIRCANVKQQR